ncbi:hypothetical protein [Streptococcus sinensis]|uniref:hypothetical protein n=1 Tax=Streptococcus sinensis TaxID=176090 RepID=UPI001C2EC723|nr:hypothetical protein [Streptococcus sinensis]MCD1277935.1 hypothetical protein [Streptococcus sinensis]
MTFNYTDKQLNSLNKDTAVYSVNSEFARRKNKKLVVGKQDSELASYETNTITTPDGQEFRVIATKSDPETGFDGMAVAPIINGKPDYKSVAVVAAGTDPNSPVNKFGPLSRDVFTALSSLSPQYEVADKFVKEIMDNPKYEVSQLTGYSQGSYMLKIGAKYHIPTTTFNTWFLYSHFSEAEKEYIQNNPAMFADYRKRHDNVVVYNDGNIPELLNFKSDLTRIYWVDYKGDSHNIYDWVFDPVTGQVIDGKGGKPLTSGVFRAYANSLRGMSHYRELKGKWASNRISSSEEIYLDAAQGQILSSSMAAAARTGADEVATLAKVAKEEIEALWSKIDFGSYTALSADEVEAIFASQGVTRAQYVDAFEAEINHTDAQMSDSATAFERLDSQLQAAIDQVLTTDAQLAKEFQQWKAEM